MDWGKDEEKALFWCSLLRPIIFGEVDEEEAHSYLKELAGKEVRFPDGIYRKLSYWTLRRKYRQYRRGSFKGLLRKPRNDQGKPRAFRKEMLDRAIELKKEQPRRSPEAINQFLRAEFGQTIAPSTLYRHLKEAGATRRKLGFERGKVRRRWTREHTHDLWVGDFEHGPYVLVDGNAVKTYLSAWIDCHSRYVVEARYYFHENLDILIDSLLRAWAVHGASRELYVDNAKVYHSRGLKAACYALATRLRHRPKRDPEAGGLIERFFQTVQVQFEAEVRAGDILTLEKLNPAFSAWLSVSYHPRVHSETKQTPEERRAEGLTVVRYVDTSEIVTYFFETEIRRVDRTFSDVTLNGRVYRVDPKLRGDKVQVRYDPFSSMEKVYLYSLHGKYLATGVLHHRQEGQTLPHPATPPKPKHDYLGLLIEQHEKQLQAQAQGIDYRPVVSQRGWPFLAFANKFAQLLGRKGGLTDFTTDELEALQKAYHRLPALHQPMLLQAFESADPKTIPSVLYQLQLLTARKET